MNRHNALGRTVDQAHEHVRAAREALAPLPAIRDEGAVG